MSFLVSTNGVNVTLNDLGARVITHPTANLDLLLEFTIEELHRSNDLKAAITGGTIINATYNGISVTSGNFDNIGSGDMAKNTYDANNDGRVDSAAQLYDGTNTVTAAQARAFIDSKAAANGLASLGADGKVPSGQLPAGSGVTSVNGASGIVVLTTTDISEGTNLYFTNGRAIVAPLTGYTSGAGTVAATDSILQAIQKLNGNITAYQVKAVSYTLTSSDLTIEVSTSGATQTLPTAVGIAGKKYTIINNSIGIVRVNTTSSQTIGNKVIGNPIFINLKPQEWLDVVSNGTNWKII